METEHWTAGVMLTLLTVTAPAAAQEGDDGTDNRLNPYLIYRF